jgi:MerR family transcriptional regulator/heat shock protein HspR
MARRPNRGEPVARANRAVYVISVAAELAGVHPQTLRMYERKGLLSPQRTGGRSRRYSEADVDRLRRIQRLTQEEGVNLAGVRLIMEMQEQITRMQLQIEGARRRMAEFERQMREQSARRGWGGALVRLSDVRDVFEVR